MPSVYSSECGAPFGCLSVPWATLRAYFSWLFCLSGNYGVGEEYPVQKHQQDGKCAQQLGVASFAPTIVMLPEESTHPGALGAVSVWCCWCTTMQVDSPNSPPPPPQPLLPTPTSHPLLDAAHERSKNPSEPSPFPVVTATSSCGSNEI